MSQPTGTFEQARAFFLDGIAHYEAGRMDAAERAFAASLALVPGRVSTLTNLGAARLKLGRVEEAVAVLREALAQEPDNAEALGHLAAAPGRARPTRRSAGRGRQGGAAQSREWSRLAAAGDAATGAGSRRRGAAVVPRSAARGADPDLVRFALGALEQAPSAAPPRHYVQQLFDSYADGFDKHLVQALQYRAPQLLVEGLGHRWRRTGTGATWPSRARVRVSAPARGVEPVSVS